MEHLNTWNAEFPPLETLAAIKRRVDASGIFASDDEEEEASAPATKRARGRPSRNKEADKVVDGESAPPAPPTTRATPQLFLSDDSSNDASNAEAGPSRTTS